MTGTFTCMMEYALLLSSVASVHRSLKSSVENSVVKASFGLFLGNSHFCTVLKVPVRSTWRIVGGEDRQGEQ